MALPKLTTLTTLSPNGPVVYWVDEVSSSLDVAWELVDADADGLSPFSSILAKSQTQGRGRQGRTWASPPGHVYAAIRLPFKEPFLGTLAPIALGFALTQAFREEGVEVFLKWPNDLLVKEGKAGGILLENRKGALIAGVGLNLGAPPVLPVERDPYAPPAAAFPLELGPPEKLWPRLAKNVMLRYNSDIPARDPDWARNFLALAEKRLAGLGREVTILQPVAEPRSNSPALTGTLTGLAPSGALRLKVNGGESLIWSGSLILPT
jgi:BirA family biotin operon repressor/biotin-[acetyl-CoA-carboxylase] ligase